MVTFVCYNCDKTLKKNQIEKHLYQCRGKPAFICVDCKKTFHDDDHKAHTSCISEQQQWHGQYYKGKNAINNSQSENDIAGLIKLEKAKINDKYQMQWMGWKTTIRKTIQNSKDDKIDLDILKQKVFNILNKTKKNCKLDIKQMNQKFLQKIKNNKFLLHVDPNTNCQQVSFVALKNRMSLQK